MPIRDVKIKIFQKIFRWNYYLTVLHCRHVIVYRKTIFALSVTTQLTANSTSVSRECNYEYTHTHIRSSVFFHISRDLIFAILPKIRNLKNTIKNVKI